jgi:hypothetical protein
MRPGIVHVAEEMDGSYWSGRFSAFHDLGNRMGDSTGEAMELEDALAWARERADRIVLRIGDEHVPVEAAQPVVRRRIERERWRDRTDADRPIAWTVTATLVVPYEVARADADALVAPLAAAADDWDAEPFDGLAADQRRARRTAKGGEAGWFSYNEPAYRLRWTREAPTCAAALAQVAVEPPAGWKLRLEAEPREPPRSGAGRAPRPPR